MSYKYELTFVGFLIVLAIEKVVEQRFTGSSYIRLWNYLWVERFLYESGALLGYAKRDELDALEQALAIPDDNHFVSRYNPPILSIGDSQDKAKKRLHEYQQRFGTEPDTFAKFLFRERFTPIVMCLMTGLPVAYENVKELSKTLNNFEQHLRLRLPVEMFYDNHYEPKRKVDKQEMQNFFLEGVGFGSYSPNLTQKMSTNYYRYMRRSIDWWFDVNEAGKLGTEKPKILSFKEQQDALLQLMAVWVRENPELLESLALNPYLKHPSLVFPYMDWEETSYYLDVIMRFGQGFPI